MQPSKDNSLGEAPSLRARSPLDALRQPTAVPVLHSTLLGSVTREDGTCDELYHERPARGGHPGAVFLISTDSPEEQLNASRRILYVIAPRTNVEAWIKDLEFRFTTSSRDEFYQHFCIDCEAKTLMEGGASQTRQPFVR